MTKILKIMMKWHFWFFGDLICSFSARRHHQISHSIYFQWHSQPYFLTQPSIVMMTLSDIFFQPYSKSIFNQLAPSVQWHSHPYFLISSRIKTSLGHFCFASYSSLKVWWCCFSLISACFTIQSWYIVSKHHWRRRKSAFSKDFPDKNTLFLALPK